MKEERLPVVCDGLRLAAGAWVSDDARGLVVLLHGIPSVAPPDPDDEGYPGFAREFAARGWAAAWGDMRAVRKSPGFFSIEGWVRDARAIVDAARSLAGRGAFPTAMVGSSAGGAVSVELVARGAPVDALVLLATPATWITFAEDPRQAARLITEEAGMALAPEVLEDPTRWADEFQRVTAELSISSVRVPLLIVHGTHDEVVPVHHADLLAAKAQRADVEIIEGAPHQLRRHPGIAELVSGWLERTIA